MKKPLLYSLMAVLLLFASKGYSQCDPTEQCNYTFTLMDDFGDGWNGNTMTVSQNGVTVAVLGADFTNGPNLTQNISLCDDVPFELFWNEGGSFPSEVGIMIINPFDQTIYIEGDNAEAQGTQLYSGIVNCSEPICLGPYPINITSVTATAASFGWYDSGQTWEILVLPAEQTPPTATESGVILETNSYTITGLETNSLYIPYVRAICGPGEFSAWTEGNVIIPTCYQPQNVSISDLTLTSAEVEWTTNGNVSQWEVLVIPAGAEGPDDSTSGIPVSTSSYTATGLAPNVDHYAYVRSLCEPGIYSMWINSQSFTPFCTAPYNLFVNGVSLNSADITWESDDAATQWEVLVQLYGAEEPNASSSGDLANTSNFTAVNLLAGTQYRVFVRSMCGTIPGEWVATAFTTNYEGTLPMVTNTGSYTPDELIESVLVNNPCITITNVSSSAGTAPESAAAMGYFTNSNPNFPLSSGIVLSTGNVANIPGPNTSILDDGSYSWQGDSQLEGIISAAIGEPMNSFNATRLEFDFTTVTEFMSFNFLFASDEYGTYQCSYADAFAFLLTDLETGVTVNLAVVPGTTTPVSVVTIRDVAYNPGCASANPGFFDAYFQGAASYSSATNFNGQTAVMTASSTVIPNHPYHIKLVVADRSDTAFDSAVFIEAGSFAAGPPECTDKLQLVAFVDENANGVKDTGENDFTYGSFVYQQNNAGDIINVNSPIGTYTIYGSNTTNTYDFSYELDAEYVNYYSVAATNYEDVSIALGSGTTVFYFPVTLTQSYNDVSVSVVPLTPPVPGSTFTNKIVYQNLGIAPASGTIAFTKDPATSIVSTNPSTTNISTGFTYNFSNLQPYEQRTILVNMSVPTIPTVNIDDVLATSASVSANPNDINLANNDSDAIQIAVASYDPNDITEAHGKLIPINQFAQDDYLYYMIRFQNMGTANAVNIRVEDMLDAQHDEESIRMISASHLYVLERVGSHLVWKFNFIHLPPALQSEDQSQGFVFFKVKLNPGFEVGDIIPNSAGIYFDTNPVVVTNTFETEFTTALATSEFENGNLMVYPNPATSIVQINLHNSADTLEKIVLYDMIGKLVKKAADISGEDAAIDVSSLSKGIYMMEITTSSEAKFVRKLVVE